MSIISDRGLSVTELSCYMLDTQWMLPCPFTLKFFPAIPEITGQAMLSVRKQLHANACIFFYILNWNCVILSKIANQCAAPLCNLFCSKKLPQHNPDMKYSRTGVHSVWIANINYAGTDFSEWDSKCVVSYLRNHPIPDNVIVIYIWTVPISLVKLFSVANLVWIFFKNQEIFK